MRQRYVIEDDCIGLYDCLVAWLKEEDILEESVEKVW